MIAIIRRRPSSLGNFVLSHHNVVDKSRTRIAKIPTRKTTHCVFRVTIYHRIYTTPVHRYYVPSSTLDLSLVYSPVGPPPLRLTRIYRWTAAAYPLPCACGIYIYIRRTGSDRRRVGKTRSDIFQREGFCYARSKHSMMSFVFVRCDHAVRSGEPIQERGERYRRGAPTKATTKRNGRRVYDENLKEKNGSRVWTRFLIRVRRAKQLACVATKTVVYV